MMDLFGLFRKEKELPEADRKWNKMWDLWAEGEAEAPYAQLMEYESEVNNGGHSQYFFNVANCGDLKAEADILLKTLPEPLLTNFQKAYEAFSGQEDICDDENDSLFEECDHVFYAQEQLLIDILKDYANCMML